MLLSFSQMLMTKTLVGSLEQAFAAGGQYNPGYYPLLREWDVCKPAISNVSKNLEDIAPGRCSIPCF